MTVLVWLLAFPLAAALGVTAVSYGLFLLARRVRPGVLLGQACPGRTAACLGRGLATAVTSLLAMIVTYPLGPLVATGRRGRAAVPGRPVVVCLHGLYHNPAAFLAFRPALARAGFDQLVVLGYSSFGSDFEAEAGRLGARLRCGTHPDAPLLFLGHSLGGLMARRLAAEPDLGRRTRAVVTLGTPHRGSALAGLALGRLGRSLRPGSRLLARLAALPDPAGARCIALCSPVDNLVVPDTGLLPDRPGWQVVVTPPVSHVAMLYHPEVIALAVAALGRPDGRP
ncbi:esterase/lipase family protein [Solidesulfovibrio sp.]